MPGLILPVSAASVGVFAGMKRAHEGVTVPTYGEPHPKKRKVTRRLRYTQPVQHIVEPVAGGYGACEDKGFFDHQLRRAIAVQCRGIGFESAKPEALERLTGLVDSFMTEFLGTVRQSMASARRTETLPQDWIVALARAGITRSSSLEAHLDTGDIPPTFFQPPFAPADPEPPAPPSLEGLLGTELSGRIDKDSKPYIPSHFPPFPSKHTYKSTPVLPQRENDPRKIREKAAEEGIDAEKSLRTLMAARKSGVQKRRGNKDRRSARVSKSHALWKAAMEECLKDEDEQERAQRKQAALHDQDEMAGPFEEVDEPRAQTRRVNLEEGVLVNYNRKFWRKSARGL